MFFIYFYTGTNTENNMEVFNTIANVKFLY